MTGMTASTSGAGGLSLSAPPRDAQSARVEAGSSSVRAIRALSDRETSLGVMPEGALGELVSAAMAKKVHL
jgi:hypothetical protein